MPPSLAFSLACMTQQPIDCFLFPAQVKIASNVTFRGSFPTCAVSVSASVSWGSPSEAGGDSLLRASPLSPWRIPSKEWAHVHFRNRLCS